MSGCHIDQNCDDNALFDAAVALLVPLDCHAGLAMTALFGDPC